MFGFGGSIEPGIVLMHLTRHFGLVPTRNSTGRVGLRRGESWAVGFGHLTRHFGLVLTGNLRGRAGPRRGGSWVMGFGVGPASSCDQVEDVWSPFNER